MSDTALAKVDFCVTTFGRPQAIERLVLSIADHYLDAAVHIADQDKVLDHDFYAALAARSGLTTPPTVSQLGFDCGLSAARNYLVSSTPRQYKLMLDDDFTFTERTDVAPMVRLLDAHPRAGVVGGGVAHDGRISHVRCRLDSRDGTLVTELDKQPFTDEQGVRYAPAEFVSNFAMMRGELFEHVRWDPQLKVFEHHDFFLRLKQTPYTVLYTPDVVVDHPPASGSSSYRNLRWRLEFMVSMMNKHRLTRMKAGRTVTELRPDGYLTRYCELSDPQPASPS